MFEFTIEDFNNGFMIVRLDGFTTFISPDFEPYCTIEEWPTC